jgi:hypothetical protein|tara:strand:- start:177 stop:347 length:171 start_codon:yes stop_codon:yes gene_type:complete
MFDDPRPEDIVVNPKSGEECTVAEFNKMSNKEKKEWYNRSRKDVIKNVIKNKKNPA